MGKDIETDKFKDPNTERAVALCSLDHEAFFCLFSVFCLFFLFFVFVYISASA
jgi:hypothetical protein